MAVPHKSDVHPAVRRALPHPLPCDIVYIVRAAHAGTVTRWRRTEMVQENPRATTRSGEFLRRMRARVPDWNLQTWLASLAALATIMGFALALFSDNLTLFPREIDQSPIPHGVSVPFGCDAISNPCHFSIFREGRERRYFTLQAGTFRNVERVMPGVDSYSVIVWGPGDNYASDADLPPDGWEDGCTPESQRRSGVEWCKRAIINARYNN